MLHAKQHDELSADSIRRTRFCRETERKRGRERERGRCLRCQERERETERDALRSARSKNVNKRGALTVKWKIIIDQLAQRCKKKKIYELGTAAI